MSEHPLQPLFEPKSIAVVGVDEPSSTGARVLANIREAGFAGELFAVAPSGTHAFQVETWGDLAALPRRAEHVVICAPPENVPSLLAQCVQHRAQVATLVSISQAEPDAQAERLLIDAITQLRTSALRVVGPSCLGVMRSSTRLNASLSRGVGQSGSLALISQSAGVCDAVLDWARAQRVGFSTVASLGAAVDVGIGDVLDYLAVDPETRAVLLYLEGTRHPRRFMSGLRALARIKPVVVVKGGRSANDSRVDEDAVFDAALRRAGAVRVATLPEMFSTAELLAHAPRVSGNRLGVVTNSTGLGVLAADRARDVSLPLPAWSASTQAQLTALRHCSAAALNPFDLGADATADLYARGMELCLADPEVDGALLLVTPQLSTDPLAVAKVVAERELKSSKPVLACFVGGPQMTGARDTLSEAGVPNFDSPEAAVEAFRHLVRYRRNRELLVQAPDVFSTEAFDIEGARLVIDAALSQGRKALSQLESKAVLSAFRIPVTLGVRTHDPNEALVTAEQMGFPVGLKIDSFDIPDKSAANGVRLNLRSAAEVRTAYRELIAAVALSKPGARVLGVTVEPMHERNGERALIAGIRYDSTFGPVIVLGPPRSRPDLDAALSFALPPLNTRLASDLIDEASKRGRVTDLGTWDAADRGALVKLLARLSDLACELPEVRDLMLDPVFAADGAVIVVDAKLEVQHAPASQRKYGHLAIAPFPRELVKDVQLGDGTPIVVRPIRPEDTQLEQDFVRELSLETRRFRFMHALSRLTDEMLVRFTQLDYDRELGLIAVQKSGPNELPLGIARYVGDSDELGCEFALVVADAWHKRGVASQLMRALISAARARQFTHMHGDVLADNSRMLRWMERLGFSIRVHPDDAMLRLVTLAL